MQNQKKVILIAIGVSLALVALVWAGLSFFGSKDEPVAPTRVEQAANPVGKTNRDVTLELDGKWRSTDDPRFVRTFSSNGAVTDFYEDDQADTVSGTWRFIEDPASEQGDLPAVTDAKVIKVMFPEEVLYFAITKLTDTELNLSYLPRGNTLSFTRSVY